MEAKDLSHLTWEHTEVESQPTKENFCWSMRKITLWIAKQLYEQQISPYSVFLYFLLFLIKNNMSQIIRLKREEMKTGPLALKTRH